MGGLVVQRYLERYPAPAAVLMASVPPQGLWLPALSLAMRDWQALQQLNVAQFLGGGCVSVESMRRTLFSADMPDAEVARHLQRFQGESACALLEMTMPRPWWDLYWAWGCGQRPNQVKPPVLVLAADKDAFCSHEMAEETAAAFGTQAVVVPGLAHVMMLEARWKAAAERILGWLQRLGL